jgi:four helix bundle protein
MLLKLNHQQLDVYSVSPFFVIECYKLTRQLPADVKFVMISHITRAALPVHLNIAESSSRKSEAQRKRYVEICRGSIIDIDAALDIAANLDYLRNINTESIGNNMVRCFRLLTGLIR